MRLFVEPEGRTLRPLIRKQFSVHANQRAQMIEALRVNGRSDMLGHDVQGFLDGYGAAIGAC